MELQPEEVNVRMGRVSGKKAQKMKGTTVNSRIWLHRLMKCISEAREKDESVWITII